MTWCFGIFVDVLNICLDWSHLLCQLQMGSVLNCNLLRIKSAVCNFEMEDVRILILPKQDIVHYECCCWLWCIDVSDSVNYGWHWLTLRVLWNWSRCNLWIVRIIWLFTLFFVLPLNVFLFFVFYSSRLGVGGGIQLYICPHPHPLVNMVRIW